MRFAGGHARPYGVGFSFLREGKADGQFYVPADRLQKKISVFPPGASERRKRRYIYNQRANARSEFVTFILCYFDTFSTEALLF